MNSLKTLFAAVLLIPMLAIADEHEDKPAPVEAEPKSFVTTHEIRVDGQRIKYRATAGTLIMRDVEGEPIAELGYTAYEKVGADPITRPLMFAWNGGPGSASIWLHMGVLGPQITQVTDLEINGRGPFRFADNPHSIIDKVDLVMVDPVGTGYSRAIGEAEGKDFWGVDNDIKSVSNFIKRWITDNNRWASPKYILGESYGGMRAGGVSYDLLTRHDIALNGVVMVSPYMDAAGGGGVGVANMVVGYTMALSGYAATAWYHDMLDDKPADLKAYIAEVDEFAITDYLDVLVRGARGSDEKRQQVAEQLGRYTGTSARFWLDARLRVTESQFVAELARQRGQVAGRLDSRFINYTPNPLSETMPFDPMASAIGPVFVATFNDYYRRVLGVEMDRPYVISGGLWKHWDRSHKDPINKYKSVAADTGLDLGVAMIRNPHMKVLVQQGYYDLATPVRASEYFIDQLPIPDSLRDNVSIEYYESGHMMYLHQPSLAKFRRDLATFIDDSL